MGLLGNIFKTTFCGGSGIDGAYNAHLAELVIRDAPPAEKKLIAEEVVGMGIRASNGRVNIDQFCDKFNRQERRRQLNLIALALAKLNVCIPGCKWMPIDNPFILNITDEEIKVNALYFIKKYNLKVNIEPGKIDIREWLR